MISIWTYGVYSPNSQEEVICSICLNVRGDIRGVTKAKRVEEGLRSNMENFLHNECLINEQTLKN